MSFAPTMSYADLGKTAQEIVENGVIVEPDAPADILADRLVEGADSQFVREFGRSLIVRSFIRLIRASRAKAKKRIRPAGFERLPLRVQVRPGKYVRFDRLNYTGAREFCKRLSRGHLDRRLNDDLLKQASELRDRLRKASKKHRGITAGELLGFDYDTESSRGSQETT